MTCREFEHRATSLTLWELSRAPEDQILGHADECQQCAAWLQQQRMLAVAMQTLHARTAACAAGPDVERALLQAFRNEPAMSLQPEMAYRFTPIAIRLSRFFEIGAYVAVAASIVVGLFLGVQLLEKRSVNLPAESRLAEPNTSSPKSKIADVGSGASTEHQQFAASGSSVNRLHVRHVRSASQTAADTTEPSQVSTEADYVPLMLCDPLSCASDAQVVRMELPNPGVSGGEQDAQMRIADIVVGYDGVVRAVRIVN